jgi:ubiquinone/menaquinone biosynthesis C-methylase UbiE
MAIWINRIITRFLRFFFKHLYTDLAWSYDAVAWLSSMGQWRTWQSAAVQHYPAGRVLELGHGPGNVQLDLIRAGNETYGVDASWQMSKIASRRLKRQQAAAKIVRSRAEALPFAAGSMSTIIATFPAEFIYSAETLSEIVRLLPERGELIVIGLARITGKAPFDRIASWLYKVTGQSAVPEASWMEPLAGSGLHAWIEIVHQPRAEVVRYRAIKSKT